jgi:acyl-homoserine lactone acylase PvdQ
MLAAPGASAFTPSAVTDHTHAINVSPPGENGLVTINEYLQNQGATYDETKPNFGYPEAHWVDQVNDYWKIDQAQRIFPNYKSANFYDPAHPGPGDTQETLANGAVIYRDARRDIPRIFAPDGASLYFAVGAAEAEDRLAQAEIFRRAAWGRLSEILGQDYASYDYQKRLDTYPFSQFQSLVTKLTPEIQSRLQSFSDGMNFVIQRDQQQGIAPAELVALGDWPPKTAQPDDPNPTTWPWRPVDTYAIASLEVQAFGDEGGQEVEHLAFYCWLKGKYGDAQAQKMFLDRLYTRDGLAPPSVPGNTVPAPQQFNLTGSQAAVDDCALNGNAAAAASANIAARNMIAFVTRRLGLPQAGSNAIAVSPARSATGNAILYGAPQVGYNVPSLFLEEEWHGGGFDTIGLGFAGIPGVLIGHGPDYAWTTTSGQTDMLDTYAAYIDAAGNNSWFGGNWVPLDKRTETVVVNPCSAQTIAGGRLCTSIPGSAPPPNCSSVVVGYQCALVRVAHPDPYVEAYGDPQVKMPVFAYAPGTVACPDHSGTNCRLAYAKRRAWAGREAGTFGGFGNYGRLDSLAQQDGLSKLDEFAKLTSNVVSAHNLVYADDQGNIAYWLAGSYPLRPAGIVPQLPLNADGSQEWGDGNTMYVPFANQPQSINPAQGWVASWNNKPSNAASFNPFDTGDSTKWGLQQHVEAIEDYLGATGPLDFNGVARAGYRAAFNDTRAKWVMPIVLNALSDVAVANSCGAAGNQACAQSGRFSEASGQLAAWFNGDSPIAGGAERAWDQNIPTPWWDESQRWTYNNGGQALWDAWWNVAQELAFHSWFNGTPQDYPGPSGDSMENTEDPFFIHALMGPTTAASVGTLAPRIDYLSANGNFPATPAGFNAEVRHLVAQSLNDTLTWLASPASPPPYLRAGVRLPDAACCTSGAISSWREDMRANGNQDMNCFGSFTVYSVPCMPWEDKGTYAQVVEITSQGGLAVPEMAAAHEVLVLALALGGLSVAMVVRGRRRRQPT